LILFLVLFPLKQLMENNIVEIIIYIGIFVFAMTGSLKARAQEMDILGGLVLAFVTAYGGGTVRDVLLGVKPVNWINNNISIILVLIATFIIFLTKSNLAKIRKGIFITDAIGLGMFTIGGIERSISYGANKPFALLLGVMTATFGGLLADIISNREPELLQNGEMYATVCAIGGIVYLLLNEAVDDDWSMIIAVLITVGVRIWSKWKQWSVPKI
jgi:uncharacterized membrane protein YeiH